MHAVLLSVAIGLLGADPSDEVVARYDERSVTFTGGEYQDEVFKYRLLKPEPLEPGKSYPLVFFLHGAGERGNDNRRQLLYLPEWMSASAYREKFPCFLIAPQCRAGKWWIDTKTFLKPDSSEGPAVTEQMQSAEMILDEVLAKYPIDRDRIYLTGLSMGGFGSWDLAARRPELFAAVVPICGGGDVRNASKLAPLQIWAFHGGADPIVQVKRTRDMIEAIKAAGGNPQYSELDGVGHDSWTPAYSDPEGVLAWMFKQRKGQEPQATAN